MPARARVCSMNPATRRGKAYRTTTRDVEHLAKVTARRRGSCDAPSLAIPGHTTKEEYFAELRANEFMGSLLVPRQRLNLAVEETGSETRCDDPSQPVARPRVARHHAFT
jgi:hypothetical protein